MLKNDGRWPHLYDEGPQETDLVKTNGLFPVKRKEIEGALPELITIPDGPPLRGPQRVTAAAMKVSPQPSRVGSNRMNESTKPSTPRWLHRVGNIVASL